MIIRQKLHEMFFFRWDEQLYIYKSEMCERETK